MASCCVEAGLKIDPNWSMFHIRMAEIYRAQGQEKDSVESEWQWMTLRGIPLERLVQLRAAYRADERSEMLRLRLTTNTAYDSIRDDPRFRELMTRVGLKVPAVTAK